MSERKDILVDGVKIGTADRVKIVTSQGCQVEIEGFEPIEEETK